MPLHRLVTLLQDGPKHWLLLQELPAHAGPLRPLSGKDKDQFAAPAWELAPRGQPGAHLFTQERLKVGDSLCPRVSHERQPVVMMAAPHASSVADIMPWHAGARCLRGQKVLVRPRQ